MRRKILFLIVFIGVLTSCVDKEHSSATNKSKEHIIEQIDSLRGLLSYQSLLLEKEKANKMIALCLDLANTYPEEPESEKALFEVTRLAWNVENKTLALKIHDRIIEGYPKSDKLELSYYMKATILDELRKKEESVKAYQTFIEKFPSSHNVTNAKFRIENIHLTIEEAALNNIH